MITKAIIEGRSSSEPNKFIVRIPLLNGIENTQNGTPKNELNTATVCSIPGILNAFNIGDIVYVGFEDNNYARPVILGHLYMGGLENESKTSVGFNLGSLVVKDQRNEAASLAKLPVNTTIGDITYNELIDLIKFWKTFPNDFNLTNSVWYNGEIEDIKARLNALENK